MSADYATTISSLPAGLTAVAEGWIYTGFESLKTSAFNNAFGDLGVNSLYPANGGNTTVFPTLTLDTKAADCFYNIGNYMVLFNSNGTPVVDASSNYLYAQYQPNYSGSQLFNSTYGSVVNNDLVNLVTLNSTVMELLTPGTTADVYIPFSNNSLGINVIHYNINQTKSQIYIYNKEGYTQFTDGIYYINSGYNTQSNQSNYVLYLQVQSGYSATTSKGLVSTNPFTNGNIASITPSGTSYLTFYLGASP